MVASADFISNFGTMPIQFSCGGRREHLAPIAFIGRLFGLIGAHGRSLWLLTSVLLLPGIHSFVICFFVLLIRALACTSLAIYVALAQARRGARERTLLPPRARAG